MRMDTDPELEPSNAGSSGVTSDRKQSKKRVITAARKEQNRLAQKAYRTRQREQKRLQIQPVLPGPRRLAPCPADSGDSGRNTELENAELTVDISHSSSHASQTDVEALITSDMAPGDLPEASLDSIPNQSAPSSLPEAECTAISLPLSATTSSEQTDRYPLGVNDTALAISGSLETNATTVFRASLLNAICIGIDLSELMYCQKTCMSPFYRPTATSEDPTTLVLAASAYHLLPASLQPTPAQILIPHHASLDLIPLPRLRERAILLCAALPRAFSLWEMKLDIYVRNALICHGQSALSGSPAAQPWEKDAWEAEPWFVSKWSMVVDRDEVKARLSVPGIPGLWM
ncbi:hypothetical protein F4802DRAFT_475539 [Xylaria palmicola]|nr:hypothetical protein F4802DRAFT_475539 [Xylaria palmicola]